MTEFVSEAVVMVKETVVFHSPSGWTRLWFRQHKTFFTTVWQ